MDAAKAGGKRRRAAEPEEEDAASDGVAAPHELQVYAAGLPYDASEDDIRAFFAPAGTVTGLKAPRFQDSGRLRGFAHVSFASRGEAEAALALDGKYLGERFISVEPAREEGAGGGAGADGPPSRPSGCTTLFVRNLPYDADEAAVKAAFARYGDVSSVRIARRYDTQASKGFGYVQFETAEGAEAALHATFGLPPPSAAGKAGKKGGAAAVAPVLVGGRAVKCDYDTGAPKASYRTADGQYYAKTAEGAAVMGDASKRGRGGKPVDAGVPRT